MFPLPQDAARKAFAGCSLVVLIGLWMKAAPVVLLGGGGLAGLGLCLSLTMFTAARLRTQMLSFSWRAEAGRVQGAAGVPCSIRCRVRNPSDRAVDLGQLLPSCVPELAPKGGPYDLHVPAHSKAEFELEVVAKAAGLHVLHGLSVLVPGPLRLFAAPLYFPTPLALRVRPQEPRLPATSASPPNGPPAPHLPSLSRPRKGDGSDVRELRELQPGDPYKAIAWKASARRGRLLVREMEQESFVQRDVVIDVSHAMRAGEPGRRPLDRALDIAALLAQAAVRDGDRISVCTVDGRELSRTASASGPLQLRRVQDALIDCVRVTDADLTEASAEEVHEAVLRYLRRQEGDARAPQVGTPRGRVAERVRRELATELGAVSDGRLALRMPLGVDADDSALRAFCLARGIALPYREVTRNFAKAHGLAQALRKSAGEGRVPRQVLLLCSLDGIPDLTTLARTLSVLRARQHHVVVAIPTGYKPEDARGGALSPFPAPALEAARLFARKHVTVVRFDRDESTAESALRMLRALDAPAPRLRSA